MTVCGSFDLEDDDFFDDTFRNISDRELSTGHSVTILSESTINNNDASNPSIETKSPNEGFPAKEILPLVNQNLNPDRNGSCLYDGTIQSSQNISEKSDTNTALFLTPKSNSVVNVEKTLVINSRFTPGFAPKVKKRKFPGPAGVFSEKNDNNFYCEESDHVVKKKTEAEIEVQDITNSQFSADDLLLPSWQNLQADVSSKSLLSTAKYYSIRRVYNETSKKKLPKHIVVPVLCVLLKKFNHAESHSVFIDDTGEIRGNIDKQVLFNFEEYLKDGVSFILKKVTFLCNVLLLTQESLVSIYLDDGTVKNIQEIDSVPCTQKLLKPMSCQCSETPLVKAARNKTTFNSSYGSPETCIHRAAENVAENHSLPEIPLVIHGNCHSPKPNSTKFTMSLKEKFSKRVSVASANVLSSNHISFTATPVSSISKKTSDICLLPSSSASINPKHDISRATPCTSKEDGHVSENSNQANVPVKVSAAEASNEASDLFGGNSDLDEFDELLGNLDEKSFLEEF